MTKRPMVTEELLNRMRIILKAKDRSPDTFSYRLSTKFTEQKWGK